MADEDQLLESACRLPVSAQFYQRFNQDVLTVRIDGSLPYHPGVVPLRWNFSDRAVLVFTLLVFSQQLDQLAQDLSLRLTAPHQQLQVFLQDFVDVVGGVEFVQHFAGHSHEFSPAGLENSDCPLEDRRQALLDGGWEVVD